MDAKRKALLELIKQMQALMSEDEADTPISLTDTMGDVEDEVLEGGEPESEEPEDEELADKKQFMKGKMPPPKGKALSISFMSLKKPKKALKYG